MVRTLFPNLVEKYFSVLVGQLTEKYNGEKTEPTYLHKTMLREEYTVDLTWGSSSINHSIVAADVVSLGSPLPLKQRGSIKQATGTIAKLGMKYYKDEKDITDIQIMEAKGTDEATVCRKLFDDTANAIKGIDVQNEILFQQALSTGMILREDPEHAGTGVRASFGYKEKNTFHAVAAKWTESGATPIDDLRQLFDKADADGVSLGYVYLSKKYFNLARTSYQGKKLVADFNKSLIIDKDLLPTPSTQQFKDALADEFGAQFVIVNSTFKYEKKDGSKVPVNPWEQANIIATQSNVVGRLVYGTLAEENNHVAGVEYAKSGSYILVSKYSETDPLKEFTCSQALCLPVIDGGDEIYILHADSTSSDALSVAPAALTFNAKAGQKTASVHYDGDPEDLSATTKSDWLTASVNTAKKLVVKVNANTDEGAAERTATVTVTDGANTFDVTVTQGVK